MNKLKRLFVALALALGMSATVIAVTVTPAEAVYSDCGSGLSCLWSGHNGTGTMTILPWSVYHGGSCASIYPEKWSARGFYGEPYKLNIYWGTSCQLNSWYATLQTGGTYNVTNTIGIQSFKVVGGP